MQYSYRDELYHHGIKGQKWGQRRFQNDDGTWTAAGKERYGDNGGGQSRSFRGNVNRVLAKVYGVNEKYYSKHGNKVMANANKSAKEAQLKKAEEADKAKNTPEAKARAEKIKKAAKIGAAVAGTALLAYGAYKLNSNIKANKLEAQRAAEFDRKMKQGRETFAALEKMLVEQSKGADFRGGQVSVTLPDGSRLQTVMGARN